MIKVEMLVGIPGSGKSTYAKQIIAKDPMNWARVNNDDIRAMLNGSVWGTEYEKMVTDLRNHIIRDALKRGKNVIIDNLNINRRHFDDVCKIAKSVNADIQVFEKAFYIELDEAMERNSKREGAARVPDDVVKKWWKDSGGKQFKFFKPRVEIYKQHMGALHSTVEAPAHIEGAQEAVLCDLDGTLSLFNPKRRDGSVDVRVPGAHVRDPYNAYNCDEDTLNEQVATILEAMYKDGYKIIFCSGREDIYRPQTEKFIKKHLGVEYQLFMRQSNDSRKDSIIKSEIYEGQIAPNYNVYFVLDDRNQVVELWRSKGLTCLQVADGNF